MNVHHHISDIVVGECSSRSLDLTVIFREINEEHDHYFVAECLEIPGCVSDGATVEEASKNLEDAMKACVSVAFEDCIHKLSSRAAVPDLTGVIREQRTLRLDSTPHLQYA